MKTFEIEAKLKDTLVRLRASARGLCDLEDCFTSDLDDVASRFTESTGREVVYLVGKARAYAEAAEVDLLAAAIECADEAENGPVKDEPASVDPTVQAVIDAELVEEDFGQTTCAAPFTPEQLAALLNMTNYRALMLSRNSPWSVEEEQAYLNGVACAFFAWGMGAALPAGWFLSPNRLLDRLRRLKKEGKAIAVTVAEAKDRLVGGPRKRLKARQPSVKKRGKKR